MSKQPQLFSRGMSTNYPALVIKVPLDGATASVHVFTTGSVLISGVKHPLHISQAYAAVVPLLDQHVGMVAIP
jgi:TATA-box binding protein (TBP) (component of TFIID and TFIIIB)